MGSARRLLCALALAAVLPACASSSAAWRGGQMASALFAARDTVSLDWRYDIDVSEGTEKVKFVLLVPQSMARRQEVRSYHTSLRPARTYSKSGNQYVEFVFDAPTADIQLTITAEVELHRYDLETALTSGVAAPDPDDLGRVLLPEPHVQSDDVGVVAAARRIAGETPMMLARAIYSWVVDTMSYGGFSESELGATGALEQREGDCTDYADLFVALCRARGVPARVAKGIVTDFGDDTSKHSWAEAWLGRLGWVPFDPLWGDLGKSTVDRMRPVYLTLSYTRNDPELDGYHDWVYWYWGTPAEIEETLVVHHAGRAVMVRSRIRAGVAVNPDLGPGSPFVYAVGRSNDGTGSDDSGTRERLQ